MKRKYNGLIAIVIIGAVLLPSAIYAIYSSQIPGGNDATRLKVFPSDFAAFDGADFKTLSRLDKEMMDIANPKPMKPSLDHDIRFWHYSDKNYHRYATNDLKQQKIDPKTAYALTFIFASSEKKFCIIDGSFYTQGAELPDSWKIVKIETGRVQVKKGKMAQWISLSETTKWGEIKKGS